MPGFFRDENYVKKNISDKNMSLKEFRYIIHEDLTKENRKGPQKKDAKFPRKTIKTPTAPRPSEDVNMICLGPFQLVWAFITRGMLDYA